MKIAILKTLFEVLKKPLEVKALPEGLTYQNFLAILQRRGLSDFLLYRYYEEIEGRGIYTMADGRKGFIFRVYPNFFVGEETTERLLSFLSSITIDDCVLHINTYASANITHIIERFKVLHHCQVMVDNRELLKEMIAFRAKALQRYSSESMFGGVGAGIDFRARDFITTISVLLPYMEDKEEEARVLKGQYTQIKANLGDFGAACFGAYDLVKMIRELLVPQSITEVNGYDDHRWLNQQMTNSSSIGKVNDDGSYHIGNKYSKTLTTQTFPLNIDIDEYRGLFYSLDFLQNWGIIRK